MVAEEKMVQTPMQRQIGDIRGIHYERSRSGEPLVLLHGIGSGLRIWDPLLPWLIPHYDVIAVDLPGHGDSPEFARGTPPDAIGFARALAGFLDELGIETAHLVGNSLGGWTALELAKLGRARSVVALSPAGLWRAQAPRYDLAAFSLTRALSRTMLPVVPMLLTSPIVRTLVMAHVFGRPWNIPPSAAVEAMRTFVRAPGFAATLRALKPQHFVGGQAIQAPVTVAWGGRDIMLLPRQSRFHEELPPQTRWLTLPGCGHVPTYDDPSLVAHTILNGVRSA